MVGVLIESEWWWRWGWTRLVMVTVSAGAGRLIAIVCGGVVWDAGITQIEVDCFALGAWPMWWRMTNQFASDPGPFHRNSLTRPSAFGRCGAIRNGSQKGYKLFGIVVIFIFICLQLWGWHVNTFELFKLHSGMVSGMGSWAAVKGSGEGRWHAMNNQAELTIKELQLHRCSQSQFIVWYENEIKMRIKLWENPKMYIRRRAKNPRQDNSF